MEERQAQPSERALLEAVFDHAPLSRADASRLLGMSRPTASGAAERLVGAGVIREAGQPVGRRGRAPQLYEPAREFGWALAVAARSGELMLSVVRLDGSVGAEERIGLDQAVAPGEFGEILRDQVLGFTRSQGVPLAAAVSVAVPVNPVTGEPEAGVEAPFPAAGANVPGVLAPLCGGPLVVDNDVNWAARWACERFPELKDQQEVLHVHLGSGLGGALTVNGRVIAGRRGRLGEIMRFRGAGHTVTGRLEALGVLGPGGYHLDVPRCRAVIREQGADGELTRLLAEAVGNAIVMLDPDEMVMSGPLAHDDRVRAELERALGTHVDGPLPRTRVLPGTVYSPLLGAQIGARDLLRDAARAAVG